MTDGAILLIDDDDLVLESLSMTLEDAGYDVTAAGSGARAAEPVHPLARTVIRGRYPTLEEGLWVIEPLLRGAYPSPDLLDPWGYPYVYLPAADAGAGDPANDQLQELLMGEVARRFREADPASEPLLAGLEEVARRFRPDHLPPAVASLAIASLGERALGVGECWGLAEFLAPGREQGAYFCVPLRETGRPEAE